MGNKKHGRFPLLKPYLKPYRTQAVLAPLFKLLEALMDLMVPIAVAAIINDGVAGNNPSIFVKQFWILIILAAAGMGFSFVSQWFAANASVGFASDLRQALFDHVQQLSYRDLDKEGSDTLITRMTSDINQVQTGVNMGLRLLLRSPFIVFGSVIMAFTLNFQCALIFLIAVPLLGIVFFWIMKTCIPLYEKAQRALDSLTTTTRENLTGVRVIRAFRAEEREVKEFDDKSEALTKLNEFVGKIAALLNPASYAMINIAAIFLIRQGAVQVNLGTMAQGDVVALYNYMAQMIVELLKLSSLIITLNRSIACADRVEHTLEIEPSQSWVSQMTAKKNPDAPAVSFDHVNFAYSSGTANVLNDISFTAAANETIGIIGPTGSGKSTLVNLIPRFYDASSGTVAIQGVNVKDWSQKDLLEKIGIVPQKATLFEGTIRDNMKLGKPDATDEEINQALITAQAKEVVDGKKGGLDAILEQNGRNLSGGQKQRLTIARALIKNPSILILDDSASALDFATDLHLRQAIRALAGKRTVFIVSQRVSSVRSADKILVLNDGMLAGSGTHEQLLKSCSVYQEIYRSQTPDHANRKEAAA